MLKDIQRFFHEAKPIKDLTRTDVRIDEFPVYGGSKEEILVGFLLRVNEVLIQANKRAGDYGEVFYTFKWIDITAKPKEANEGFFYAGVKFYANTAICSVVVLGDKTGGGESE